MGFNSGFKGLNWRELKLFIVCVVMYTADAWGQF